MLRFSQPQCKLAAPAGRNNRPFFSLVLLMANSEKAKPQAVSRRSLTLPSSHPPEGPTVGRPRSSAEQTGPNGVAQNEVMSPPPSPRHLQLQAAPRAGLGEEAGKPSKERPPSRSWVSAECFTFALQVHLYGLVFKIRTYLKLCPELRHPDHITRGRVAGDGRPVRPIPPLRDTGEPASAGGMDWTL